MFTQPVSMECTQEQYEKDLKTPLLEMGYEELNLTKWTEHPYLITNYMYVKNRISNADNTVCESNGRYFIDHYNPKLFLALAAMTDNPSGIAGEWWVCIEDVVMKASNKIKYNKDHSYIGLGNTRIKNNLGETNHYWTDETARFKHFRKMTKEELITKFTQKMEKEHDLKELLQSGRIVELRNGIKGILIQTNLGLLIQFTDDKWEDLEMFNRNLMHKNGNNRDIMKIRELNYRHQILPTEFQYATIIWKREEVKEYTLDQVLKMAGLDKSKIIVKTS